VHRRRDYQASLFVNLLTQVTLQENWFIHLRRV